MELNFLEQDIIELLIFQPRTVGALKAELLKERCELRETLEGLQARGLVRVAESRNPDNPPVWAYCGGPVSEFFNYALTKGTQDGQRLSI